jgi:hypothetical protein
MLSVSPPPACPADHRVGSEDKREAYSVLLIRSDGSTEIFSSYEAA